MAVRPRGKPSRTTFVRRATVSAAALLEVTIHTGRTHQIRVHLRHAGLPIVGDPVYGGSAARSLAPERRRRLDRFPRPALHAWKLRFRHPLRGDELHLTADVPDDLRGLWSDLGGSPSAL